jgi:hypothetical protein
LTLDLPLLTFPLSGSNSFLNLPQSMMFLQCESTSFTSIESK